MEWIVYIYHRRKSNPWIHRHVSEKTGIYCISFHHSVSVYERNLYISVIYYYIKPISIHIHVRVLDKYKYNIISNI